MELPMTNNNVGYFVPNSDGKPRNRSNLVMRYGDPLVNKKVWERNNIILAKIDARFVHVRVTTPKGYIIWKNRFGCHKDIKTLVEATFKAIADAGLASEVHTFDGCYNPRLVRGGSSISIHAWGYAIDLNAATNGLGQTPTISKALVDIFKAHGWTWGGDFRRKDGMHFQAVAEEG